MSAIDVESDDYSDVLCHHSGGMKLLFSNKLRRTIEGVNKVEVIAYDMPCRRSTIDSSNDCFDFVIGPYIFEAHITNQGFGYDPYNPPDLHTFHYRSNNPEENYRESNANEGSKEWFPPWKSRSISGMSITDMNGTPMSKMLKPAAYASFIGQPPIELKGDTLQIFSTVSNNRLDTSNNNRMLLTADGSTVKVEGSEFTIDALYEYPYSIFIQHTAGPFRCAYNDIIKIYRAFYRYSQLLVPSIDSLATQIEMEINYALGWNVADPASRMDDNLFKDSTYRWKPEHNGIRSSAYQVVGTWGAHEKGIPKYQCRYYNRRFHLVDTKNEPFTLGVCINDKVQTIFEHNRTKFRGDIDKSMVSGGGNLACVTTLWGLLGFREGRSASMEYTNFVGNTSTLHGYVSTEDMHVSLHQHYDLYKKRKAATGRVQSLHCTARLRHGVYPIGSVLQQKFKRKAANGSSDNASFNHSLAMWNTKNVESMFSMFSGARRFNSALFGIANDYAVKDMSWMFSDAIIFNQSIDAWDVTGVDDMQGMFCGAILFDRPLQKWNTRNVQSMSSMFHRARRFNSPLFQIGRTWSVTDMSSMFAYATRFNQPLGSWDVSNVLDMTCMFQSASAFNQSLVRWKPRNVRSMQAMFSGASRFNSSLFYFYVPFNVTQMDWMFAEASVFNQPLYWNVSEVISMAFMFRGALAFNQSLSEWCPCRVTSMDEMFCRAASFNSPLFLYPECTSLVTSMRLMFGGASSFNQPLNWNVSKVTSMDGMFDGAVNFNKPLNLKLSSVTSMQGMFGNAAAFNQPIRRWHVSKVTNMSGMFFGAQNFNQPIEKWDVSNVQTMNSMFCGAQNFDHSIEEWDVSNVQTMNSMFENANNFNHPLSRWDVSKVTSMNRMFFQALSFNQPLRWNVCRVLDMGEMFRGATGFHQFLEWLPPHPINANMFQGTTRAGLGVNHSRSGRIYPLHPNARQLR